MAVLALEYVALVAPPIAVTPLNHWYESGAVPDAEIVNDTAAPAVTVVPDGCWVIAGATAATETVSFAAAVVADPTELDTVQV